MTQLTASSEPPTVSGRAAVRIIASASVLAWCALLGLVFSLL